MVVVSYSGKEINAKLVYYGPGLSGKTTNLEYIYQSVPSTNRGKMVSMKTRTERTLFFDFLPIDLGDIGGFKTRFLLYTVPGQVYYNATRKLVLRGVDAVIFVADSGRGKMEENIESLQNLRENLREYGLSLDEMPWVIQYNKRDLPDAYSLEELDAALNPGGVPTFGAVATTGDGVFEAFRGIARLLLNKLSKEIKLGPGAKASTGPAAGPAAPPQGRTPSPEAASHPAPAAPAGPRPGESAILSPPPGLMTGGPGGRGYRPPVPKGTESPSTVMPRPSGASVPTRPTLPPRPAGTGGPSSVTPPAGRQPYRPPVPGAAPGLPPGATAVPRPDSPHAPEPPIRQEPPAQEAGASWFQDGPPAGPPQTSMPPEEDTFSPSLDLVSAAPGKPDAGADPWLSEDSGSVGQEYDLSDLEDDTSETDWPSEAAEGLHPESAVSDAGLDRAESLARQFDQGAPEQAEPEDQDDSPGFWGRLFRRRKDKVKEEQYRRYPSRLDMPAGTEDQAPLSAEPEPTPAAYEPAESLDFGDVPATADLPEFAAEAEPRPSVTLHIPGAGSRETDWDAAGENEEPVFIERTLEIPVRLSPTEIHRGVRLRLTLDVLVEAAEGEDSQGLEDTRAA